MNTSTDQTIHEEQEQRRRHRHRLGWLMVGGIALAVLLLLAGLMWPEWQRQAYFQELRTQGVGIIQVQPEVYLLSDLSDTLQDYAGVSLPLPKRPARLDFTQVPLDDETLLRFIDEPYLQDLRMAEAEVTSPALLEFAKQADGLRMLTVLNCDQISPDTAREIRSQRPDVMLEYRGTAYLGIQASDFEQGCVVYYVQPKSAAEEAGLSSGDIILEFDGVKVDSFAQLVELIARRNPGDEVVVKYRVANEIRERVTRLRGWTD